LLYLLVKSMQCFFLILSGSDMHSSEDHETKTEHPLVAGSTQLVLYETNFIIGFLICCYERITTLL